MSETIKSKHEDWGPYKITLDDDGDLKIKADDATLYIYGPDVPHVAAALLRAAGCEAQTLVPLDIGRVTADLVRKNGCGSNSKVCNDLREVLVQYGTPVAQPLGRVNGCPPNGLGNGTPFVALWNKQNYIVILWSENQWFQSYDGPPTPIEYPQYITHYWPPASKVDASAEIAELKRQLADITADANRWWKQVEDYTNRCAEYRSTIARLEAEIEEYKRLLEKTAKERAKSDRDRDALAERVKVLEEAMPRVSNEGIQFGNTWLGYDKMLGYEGPEDKNARDSFYRGIIPQGLLAWANKCKEACPIPPPAATEVKVTPQSKLDAIKNILQS